MFYIVIWRMSTCTIVFPDWDAGLQKHQQLEPVAFSFLYRSEIFEKNNLYPELDLRWKVRILEVLQNDSEKKSQI